MKHFPFKFVSKCVGPWSWIACKEKNEDFVSCFLFHDCLQCCCVWLTRFAEVRA